MVVTNNDTRTSTETAVIPCKDMTSFQNWLKEEYASLKHRQNVLPMKSVARHPIHNQLCELIKCADHAGLDLLEGGRIEFTEEEN